MRIRKTTTGLNRRRFLAASAAGLGTAGLGAAGLTGAAAASASPASLRQPGSRLVEAVLAAFQNHRLVAIAKAHAGQEIGDQLLTLVSDPRLYGVVNDIVVEFGNAYYQDTIDTFVLDGQPVNDADLRPVWRNSTQSPAVPIDSPVDEEIYRRVRAVNWTLPPGRRIRVLAGDPPFDWSTITDASQIPLGQRDSYPASLVGQQILAKGRRGLLFYGGDHLYHSTSPLPPTTVSLIEQQTGARAYVILGLLPLSTDPGGVFTKLAAYRRGSFIPTAGTWLGQVSAGVVLPGAMTAPPGKPPKLTNPWCGYSLGQLADAVIYLGQAGDMTASWPNPAIYLDTAYWTELQRRNRILGSPFDLDTFLQPRPPAYPQVPAGPACLPTGGHDASPAALAFVVDHLASVQPRRPRCVEIRSWAEALRDYPAPSPGMSAEILRVHPERVMSFGLDGLLGEPDPQPPEHMFRFLT